jgi:hypothetical protein
LSSRASAKLPCAFSRNFSAASCFTDLQDSRCTPHYLKHDGYDRNCQRPIIGASFHA